MLIRKLGIFLLILSGVSSPIFAAPPVESPVPQVIRVPKPLPKTQAVHNYFVGLLQLALEKGADGRKVPQIVAALDVEQGRAVYELMKGDLLDVNWMGSDDFRTKQLRIIPIPLERGLFGYRRLIIHKDSKVKFEAIKALGDLKLLSACQGLSWPDTEILRHAGLNVHEVSNFEGLFQQVAAKRCDYFPRGYIEPEIELAQRQLLYPMLEVHEKILLHYPYGLFFFVNKKNEALARWIELGLNRLIDTGEFSKYIRENELTKPYFPLKKNPILIEIANPSFGESMNTNDSRYWLIPADFY